MDFKVRDSGFRVGTNLKEKNFKIVALGLLLSLGEEAAADFFKDQIVLIWDFKNDMHATPFGSSPGILLIYNAYLTLEDGSNLVSAWWLLLLLAGFTLISWRIFNDIEFTPPRWLRGLFRSRLAQWVLEAIDEIVLLIALTVLSYFLFNVHVNILVLLIYCKIVDVLWNLFRRRFRPSTPKSPQS